MKLFLVIPSISFLLISTTKMEAQIDTMHRDKSKPLPDSIAPLQENMPTQKNPGNPTPMPNSNQNNGKTIPMPTQPLPPTQQVPVSPKNKRNQPKV